MTDVTLTIAGQAGQGIDTASELLARALVRSGYYTFSYPNLMSRIRGGHNFIAARVSDRQVYSVPGKFNALLAMDERSVNEHRGDMVEGGVIIAEPAKSGSASALGTVPIRGQSPSKDEGPGTRDEGLLASAAPVRQYIRGSLPLRIRLRWGRGSLTYICDGRHADHRRAGRAGH